MVTVTVALPGDSNALRSKGRGIKENEGCRNKSRMEDKTPLPKCDVTSFQQVPQVRSGVELGAVVTEITHPGHINVGQHVLRKQTGKQRQG